MKLQKREIILIYLLGVILVVMLGVLLVVMPAMTNYNELKEEADIVAANRREIELKISVKPTLVARLAEAEKDNEKIKTEFHGPNVKIGDVNYDLTKKEDVSNFFYDQVLQSEDGADEGKRFYMNSATGVSFVEGPVFEGTDKIKTVGYSYNYTLSGGDAAVNYDTLDEFLLMLDRINENEALKNVYFQEFTIDEIEKVEGAADNVIKGKFLLFVSYVVE